MESGRRPGLSHDPFRWWGPAAVTLGLATASGLSFNDGGHVNSTSHSWAKPQQRLPWTSSTGPGMRYSWNNLQACLSDFSRNSLSDPIPLSAKISQNCFQLLTTTKLVCNQLCWQVCAQTIFTCRCLHFANVPVISVLYFSLKKKCSCNLWNIKIIFIYLKIPIFKFANSKHWLQILANQQEIERYSNFYLYLLWIVD